MRLCICVPFLGHHGVTDLILPHIFVQFSSPLSFCPAQVSHTNLATFWLLKTAVFHGCIYYNTIKQAGLAILEILKFNSVSSTVNASLGCWCSSSIAPLLCEWPEVMTQANVPCDHTPFSHCTLHMALVTVCFKIHKCPWGHLHKHIPKHDEQAPSAGRKQQIHQNQNVCPRENTKGLTYWKGALSIFSDQFFSVSCPLRLLLQNGFAWQSWHHLQRERCLLPLASQ